MKISCNVVRDLLPLYTENLASDDTIALVDQHLSCCEDCIRQLEHMKKAAPVVVDASPVALNKVKKTIHRRRVASVLAAVATLLSLSALFNTYLHTPFQLTMKEALDDFYVREDGAVVIDYSPYVTGRSLAGSNQNWFINQYSTRYNMWRVDHRKSLEEIYGLDGIVTEEEQQRYDNIEILYGRWETPDGKHSSDADMPWTEEDRVVEWESEKNWWYSDPNGLGNDTLLHDAGQEYPEKDERMCFSPVYPVLFFGGSLMALAMLLLNRFAKGNSVKELAVRFLILSGSLVFSVVFTSGGRIFTSCMGVIDRYWSIFISMNTVLLTLTIHFWRQLYLLYRQDRTI